MHARKFITAIAGIVSLALSGCQDMSWGPVKTDVVKAAKSWPPYRPPVVADPIQLAEQQSSTANATGTVRLATTPDLRPTPVVRPFEEWGLPETAVDSLGRIGSPAVPALIQAMGNENPDRRVQAASVLARIGPAARQAVPRLVEALHDDNSSVQKAAARALGQIGPAAAQAVEPLLELVEQGE